MLIIPECFRDRGRKRRWDLDAFSTLRALHQNIMCFRSSPEIVYKVNIVTFEASCDESKVTTCWTNVALESSRNNLRSIRYIVERTILVTIHVSQQMFKRIVLYEDISLLLAKCYEKSTKMYKHAFG